MLENTEKKTTSTTKKSATKKTTTSKEAKTTVAQKKETKSTKKETVAKKATLNKEKNAQAKTTVKPTTKTKVKASVKATPYIPEYYDLPESYDKTVVKILAQTPNKLFVYWEISNNDREKFTTKYGDDFFNNSYPILLITNDTFNYKFEVTINDFANCWYLDINDANCKYSIELARKPIFNNNNIRDEFISVSHSNNLDIPNDSILFNTNLHSIEFKNFKTNSSMFYDFTHLKTNSTFENSNLPFQNAYGNYEYNNANNQYNNENPIFDFYKKLYYNSQSELFYKNSNPSS